jgi:hypothetical protein
MPEAFPRSSTRVQIGDLADCGNGRLISIYRQYGATYNGSASANYHLLSESTDDGDTWSMPRWVTELRSTLSDIVFETDPATLAAGQTATIYGVFNYEKRWPCNSAEQNPRERLVLVVSKDCGASWQYLMDLDNWEGNNSRFRDTVMRIIDGDIWVAAQVAPASTDDTTLANDLRCVGTSGGAHGITERRMYRIDKSKLPPPAPMPPLLSR